MTFAREMRVLADRNSMDKILEQELIDIIPGQEEIKALVRKAAELGQYKMCLLLDYSQLSEKTQYFRNQFSPSGFKFLLHRIFEAKLFGTGLKVTNFSNQPGGMFVEISW